MRDIRAFVEAAQTTKLALLTTVFSHLFFTVKNSRDEQNQLKQLHQMDLDQASQEPPRESARRVPSLDKAVRIWYNFSIIYLAISTLKYSVLIALEFKALKQYRYLSCLLIGRLAFNGRLTPIMVPLALNISSFVLLWDVVMSRVRPKLRLDCLEFLLYQIEKVRCFEARHQSVCSSTSKSSGQRATKCLGDPLMEVQNSILLQSMPGNRRRGQVITLLRPNRTLGSWLRLRELLLLILWPSMALLVIIVPFVTAMALPLTLTKPGFEHTYHQCISWIRLNTNHLSPYQRYIYSKSANATNMSMAFVLPYENFCPFNLYHVMRITMDIMDSIFLWLSCCFAHIFNTTVALVMGADVRQYSRQLDLLLKRFIDGSRIKLETTKRSTSSTSRTKRNHKQEQEEAEVANLQAVVLDHFNLVAGYNQFVSFHGLFSITVWLLLSAFTSSYLYAPGDQTQARSGLVERHLLHACSTVYMVVIMAAYATSRTASRCTFQLVASAAALDSSHGAAKQRWLTILSLYSPRPLYCFTILGSIEVSWLLAFKMAAWIVSFVLIISNFIVVYLASIVEAQQRK